MPILAATLAEGAVFFQPLATPLTAQGMRIRRALHPSHEEQCVLCRQPFQQGETVARCFTHHQLFPNCMAHHACITWDALAATAQAILDDWQAAQRYTQWF